MKKTLTLETLDLFFRRLSEVWPDETEILLLGGAAGLVMGGERPTRDVDFEVSFAAKKSDREAFQKAIQQSQNETGIDAQFSEAVERWSMISFLDYAKHRHPFKRYGKIHVFFLDPLYWSIGKVSRYWDQDIQDMLAVFSKQKVDPIELAQLWKRALHDSPLSDRLIGTRKQMADFFKTYGRMIWKNIPLDDILPPFEK